MKFDYTNDGLVISGEITFENDVSFAEFEVSSQMAEEYIVGATGESNTLSLGGVERSTWPNAGMPVGGIIMWSGSGADIPSGWAICNGAAGTPNLCDKFIIGAGGSYSVGATGGSSTVTLSENNIPAHTHSITAEQTQGAHTGHNFPTEITATLGDNALELSKYDSATPIYTEYAGSHSHVITINSNSVEGGGAAHNNLPPFYTLAYIMYLG